MEFIEAQGPVAHKWNEKERQVEFEPCPILKPGEKVGFNVRCKALDNDSVINTAIL